MVVSSMLLRLGSLKFPLSRLDPFTFGNGTQLVERLYTYVQCGFLRIDTSQPFLSINNLKFVEILFISNILIFHS